MDEAVEEEVKGVKEGVLDLGDELGRDIRLQQMAM
jgi:hypothetical protein